MAVALRSLALLCVAGASLALFVQELVGSWLIAFVRANTLTLESRQHVIASMVLCAGVAAVIGLLVWSRGNERLRRFAHLAAPAILLGLLPPLCVPSAWSSPLNAALSIGVVVLLAERLYRMAFAAALELHPAGSIAALGPRSRRLRRWLPAALVAAGVIGYAIYMCVFTLRMHGRFQTYNFDLGQYDNIFWNTLHGRPLRDAPLGMNKNWEELRDHAVLSTFFFLPIYAIKPGGPILLVIQSCTIALGAVPLYRFAARRLPRSYAAAIAFAYLLYPPTHGLQFYDFHFQPIAAAFVLFVIDFVDGRRYWLCALAFIVAIGCREDISVGLAMLGAFLALTGYRIWPGIVIAGASTAYFVAMRFFIMPSFGGWGFQDVYKDLFPVGAPNFGGIIQTMISNPAFTFQSLLTADKLRYTLQVLLPLAFLPVRRSWLAASFIPGAIFTVLTTEYPPTIDIGFQYSGHFLPYLFPAAAVALGLYGGEGDGLAKRRAALWAMITGTALTGVFWGAIPPRELVHGGFSMMPMRAPNAAERQRDRDMKELHAMVPKDASLAVSESEMTHISHLDMRGLRDGYDADYILYGKGTGFGGSTNAERALATGQWEMIAQRAELALLRRKTAAPTRLAPQQPSLSRPPEHRPGPPPPPAGSTK